MFSCCPTQLRNKLSTKNVHQDYDVVKKSHHSSFCLCPEVLRAQLCAWSQLWGARRCSRSSPASSMTQRQFCQPNPRSWIAPWSSLWPEPHTSPVLTQFLKPHLQCCFGLFFFFAARFILAIVSLFASLLIIVFDWNPSRVICHLLPVCADFFTGSDSIQGTWCKDILQTIMSFTPHNWASHTLSCFPAPLQVQILCYAKYSSNNCGLLLFFSVK